MTAQLVALTQTACRAANLALGEPDYLEPADVDLRCYLGGDAAEWSATLASTEHGRSWSSGTQESPERALQVLGRRIRDTTADELRDEVRDAIVRTPLANVRDMLADLLDGEGTDVDALTDHDVCATLEDLMVDENDPSGTRAHVAFLKASAA